MKKLISLLMTITLCLNIFSIAIVNADSSDFVYPEEGNPYGYNFSLFETPDIDMDSQNGIITLFKEANLYHAETLEDIKAIEPYVNIEFIEADVPLNTPEYEDDNISLFSDTTETSHLIAKISYIPNQKYTGEAIEPEITVTHMNGTVLVKDVDYTVSFSNNTEIGVATVYVTGIGSYIGTIQGEFNITEEGAIEITNDMITPISDQEYTGKAITPNIVVTDVEGNTLIKDTDYVVSYTDNIEIGTAYINISGIGAYMGNIQVSFNITEPVIVTTPTPKPTPNPTLNAYLSYIMPIYTNDIKIDGFWNNGITGEGVKVAIIDSGIYREHEIFEGVNIEQGMNVAAFVTGDENSIYDTSDQDGHGTEVASVLCGRIKDKNMSGLMDKTTLVPYKDDIHGSILPSAMVKAVEQAVCDDCDVISISQGAEGWGYFAVRSIYEVLSKHKNIIVCAAVGNEGLIGNNVNWPAMFPNVIGVGAVDDIKGKNNERIFMKAYYSTSNSSVFVSAPGHCVVANNDNSSSYAITKGTSFATPLVAAAAIGVKQIRHETTFNEFMEILKKTSIDLEEEGYDINTGWGMINYENIYNYMMSTTDFTPQYYKVEKLNNNNVKIVRNDNYIYYKNDGKYDNPIKNLLYIKDDGSYINLVRDSDYIIKETKNTDSYDKAIIVIEGLGFYEGKVDIEFDLSMTRINEADISGVEKTYIYNGSPITPEPIVKINNELLVKDVDYILKYSYSNVVNAGSCVNIEGIGKHEGEYKTVSYMILPKPLIYPEIIIENISNQNYKGDGHFITPEPVIKDGNKILIKDKDYELIYKNNSNIGTATIEINGIGNYTDTVIKTFTIENAPVATETPTIKPTEMPISTTQPTSAPTESQNTTPESTDKPEISPVPTENDDYDIITSIEYDNIQKVLKFKAINNTENNIKACGIMIIKDEKGVLKAVYTLNDILVGENTKVVNMPQNEGYTAQFLVWDSLTNMKPIDRVKLSQYAE